MIETFSTNLAKYRTKNPLVQFLIRKFLATVNGELRKFNPESVLDVGCGEAEGVVRLSSLKDVRYCGVDSSFSALTTAVAQTGTRRFIKADASMLPLATGAFDVVICLEVLEHTNNPEVIVAEALRVCSRGVIFSVPYEPYFRLGNLLRGKYCATFGNHPEHIQHWNRHTLASFFKKCGLAPRITVAFPWIVATFSR